MAESIVSEVELDAAALLSVRLDDAISILSEALAGNEPAEEALDELVRQLNGHAGLTWHVARWWDMQTGPVTTETATQATLRWFQVVAAFRAAMEL